MVLGKCAIDANDVKIVPFNSLEPGIVEKTLSVNDVACLD